MKTEMNEWGSRARCASGEEGINPRDFQVPLRGNNQNKAKLICAECPVQMQCLRWALENNEIWGVWGGLDEAEVRRALSVDAHGDYVQRCRPPGCPNPRCRARPSALQIIGEKRTLALRCTACQFTWRSPTSVQAIKSYRRNRLQLERRRLRIRAHIVVVASPVRRLSPPVPQEPVYVPMSLVASAGPGGGSGV